MNTSIQELNGAELHAMTGGNPLLVPIIIGISIGAANAIVGNVVNNWDHFKAGFSGAVDPSLTSAK